MATTFSVLKCNARKVVCIGRNYVDHINELRHSRPKQPLFFLKPSSSILPPGSGPVLRPRGVTLHHEVELALVMGEDVRNMDASNERGALDAIQGYAVGIDMTARNIQEDAIKRGLPWEVSKGFDTFLPISNFIPKDKIPQPHAVELYLAVNGKTQQQASTSLMLFRIPQLLSTISRVMRLERGDLVLTGTPKGVGPVEAGDVMTAGVRVNGREVEEGRIKVDVKDHPGPYQYTRD